MVWIAAKIGRIAHRPALVTSGSTTVEASTAESVKTSDPAHVVELQSSPPTAVHKLLPAELMLLVATQQRCIHVRYVAC